MCEVVEVESVRDQLSTLTSMAIGGLITGLLFDLYRLARGLIRPRRLLTDIGDLLFWLVVTPILFVILVNDNFGQVRVYVFLGWVIGFLLYRALFSSSIIYLVLAVTRLCSRIVDGLSRLFTLLQRALVKPFYRAGRRARRHKRRSKETVAVRRTGAAKIVARRPKSRIRFVVSRWFLSLRRMFKGFF